ncbi:MAG TPA: YeeE/YedE thiosulfate transporter family protein [Marinobacterium sp.]|nr:YeeE/YedE thiosulfate transporter family protein [Marinobacterium sp.]
MEIVNFTPVPAFIGGALIGLSAAFLLLVKGRVAGISGIAGGIILPEKGDVPWRILFVLGLILGGFIYQWMGLAPDLSQIQAQVGKGTLIIAGLLVGVGTTVGTGCTSGHGICGLARRSPRSLVATLTFMGSAFVTVFIVRHLVGA